MTNAPSTSARTTTFSARNPAQIRPGKHQSNEMNDSIVIKSKRRCSHDPEITPLSVLTPFVLRWRICGIANLCELREPSSPTASVKKIFHFQITDENGDAIRLSSFDTTAEKFYATVQNNQCYYISGGGRVCYYISGGGRVVPRKKQYNCTPHDYEIVLSNECEVEFCEDKNIPQPKFGLYNLHRLNEVHKFVNESMDVIAIVDRVNETTDVVVRKDNSTLKKKSVELIDKSSVIVELILWGDQTKRVTDRHLGQVIAIRGAFVREFMNGFSLSCYGSSEIEFNPPCKELNELVKWYQLNRDKIQPKSLSQGAGIALPRDLRLIGLASQPRMMAELDNVYFNIIGFVSNHQQNVVYKACPEAECKKKVQPVEETPNLYRCEKCNKNTPNFKFLYNFRFELTDFTGTYWVTAFDDQAEKIIGHTADEIGQLQEQNNLEYVKIMQRLMWNKPMNYRLRAKHETYQDVARVVWSVNDVKPVNYKQYNEILKETIGCLNSENATTPVKPRTSLRRS
uniref:Replication protein A subunit n=1 Tax=Acrobeloides nanus TaxID=290746 RepID=A0A914EJ86_9BILA